MGSNVKAELNSSMTLQCRAESQPGAECHWTLEDAASVYVGEKLIAQALSWQHQGIYNCAAFNPVTRPARSALVLARVVGESFRSTFLWGPGGSSRCWPWWSSLLLPWAGVWK